MRVDLGIKFVSRKQETSGGILVALIFRRISTNIYIGIKFYFILFEGPFGGQLCHQNGKYTIVYCGIPQHLHLLLELTSLGSDPSGFAPLRSTSSRRSPFSYTC